MSKRARVEYWIAKVPEFVLEDWERRSEHSPSDPVAHLITSGAPATPSSLPTQFTLETNGAMSDTTSRFEFVVRPDYLPTSAIVPPTMLIISDDGKSCALEGKAALFADVRPAADQASSYQTLIDERKTRYESDLHTQKIMIDESAGGRGSHLKMVSGLSNAAGVGPSRVRPVVQRRADRAVDKRVRVNEKELKNRLFTLFDIKPNYKMAELAEQTQQPQAYLKEILDQICTQHRSGPLVYQYVLRDNYRLTTDVPDAEPTA